MKEIITQHGWCLNANMWINLKNEFIKKNFSWQDNERGYFYGEYKDSKWKENSIENNLKIVICHSLGTQLINKNVLKKASHAVLINSFFNFIPTNNRRDLIIRTLNKMERKIKTKELEYLIKEFIERSFLPNKLESNYEELFEINNTGVNSNFLLNDFKKLYIEEQSFDFFSKDCKMLIIKSTQDLILEANSIDNLIRFLNKVQSKKPKVIEISKQGHIVTESVICKIIKKWLDTEI